LGVRYVFIFFVFVSLAERDEDEHEEQQIQTNELLRFAESRETTKHQELDAANAGYKIKEAQIASQKELWPWSKKKEKWKTEIKRERDLKMERKQADFLTRIPLRVCKLRKGKMVQDFMKANGGQQDVMQDIVKKAYQNALEKWKQGNLRKRKAYVRIKNRELLEKQIKQFGCAKKEKFADCLQKQTSIEKLLDFKWHYQDMLEAITVESKNSKLSNMTGMKMGRVRAAELLIEDKMKFIGAVLYEAGFKDAIAEKQCKEEEAQQDIVALRKCMIEDALPKCAEESKYAKKKLKHTLEMKWQCLSDYQAAALVPKGGSNEFRKRVEKRLKGSEKDLEDAFKAMLDGKSIRGVRLKNGELLRITGTFAWSWKLPWMCRGATGIEKCLKNECQHVKPSSPLSEVINRTATELLVPCHQTGSRWSRKCIEKLDYTGKTPKSKELCPEGYACSRERAPTPQRAAKGLILGTLSSSFVTLGMMGTAAAIPALGPMMAVAAAIWIPMPDIIPGIVFASLMSYESYPSCSCKALTCIRGANHKCVMMNHNPANGMKSSNPFAGYPPSGFRCYMNKKGVCNLGPCSPNDVKPRGPKFGNIQWYGRVGYGNFRSDQNTLKKSLFNCPSKSKAFKDLVIFQPEIPNESGTMVPNAPRSRAALLRAWVNFTKANYVKAGLEGRYKNIKAQPWVKYKARKQSSTSGT